MATRQAISMKEDVLLSQAIGGETNNQTQAIVVVQQQQALDQGNKFHRWSYLIFGIGMSVYQLFLLITFTLAIVGTQPIFTTTTNGETTSDDSKYGALYFICGILPSIIAFIWMINDSTVFCSGNINKICCCELNGWIMIIPIIISVLLRLILWCSLFGIMTDVLGSIEYFAIWTTLIMANIDVGPFILLSIDWWLYYGKRDYNGLFGHKLNPLRCITALSIIIMVFSWLLLFLFEEIADDVGEYICPWIAQGILSTTTLVFAAFFQFSGSIQGAFVCNTMSKFVCWGLGIAQCILTVVVWGYILKWAFEDLNDWVLSLILVIYGVYYSGLTIPIIWALFSIQVKENKIQLNEDNEL